ncbi:MAG: GNAT family N-acetyltransferase [Defluviitaleaceae bacterium]|nr:GNAT family N-acetyltransferase [Defluviitaleaceae bacterium]MCL2239938.1 GNAT family N-acetyltransferase [Defluviitaleaceae bacterium]
MKKNLVFLQPVTSENLSAVWNLKADPNLVAPNNWSLAEAYISLREAVDEDELDFAETPFAILHNETVVGFAMISLEDGEDIDAGENIYWLSRFMIDDKHQGKGYGKEAMAWLINWVKSKPHGYEVKCFYTSVVPTSDIATKLYERMGFVKTGAQIEDEDIMKLVL